MYRYKRYGYILLGNSKVGYAEMLPSGSFVLRDAAGSVFWSKSTFSSGAYMLLQDNANLVILSEDDSLILWQTNITGSC